MSYSYFDSQITNLSKIVDGLKTYEDLECLLNNDVYKGFLQDLSVESKYKTAYNFYNHNIGEIVILGTHSYEANRLNLPSIEMYKSLLGTFVGYLQDDYSNDRNLSLEDLVKFSNLAPEDKHISYCVDILGQKGIEQIPVFNFFTLINLVHNAQRALADSSFGNENLNIEYLISDKFNLLQVFNYGTSMKDDVMDALFNENIQGYKQGKGVALSTISSIVGERKGFMLVMNQDSNREKTIKDTRDPNRLVKKMYDKNRYFEEYTGFIVCIPNKSHN